MNTNTDRVENWKLISAPFVAFVFLAFFAWVGGNWLMECGEPGGQCFYAPWAKGDIAQ